MYVTRRWLVVWSLKKKELASNFRRICSELLVELVPNLSSNFRRTFVEPFDSILVRRSSEDTGGERFFFSDAFPYLFFFFSCLFGR